MSKRINTIFSNVSRHYDTMNHVMSLGIDRTWRHAAAKEAAYKKGSLFILDVATGTGDLAFDIAKISGSRGIDARITGTDFNKRMLAIARQKAKRSDTESVMFEYGDALRMKYKGGSFDVVVSGFALRNFDDLQRFAAEARRVLKKGGRLVLLDMAQGDSPFVKAFFSVYSRIMLLMGSFVHKGAYSWLVRSIKDFDKNGLSNTLKYAGFRKIRT